MKDGRAIELVLFHVIHLRRVKIFTWHHFVAAARRGRLRKTTTVIFFLRLQLRVSVMMP